MHTNIKDLKVGERYTDVYIVRQHAVKSTKSGGQYLNLTLSDKTGDINANCWNIPPAFNPDLIVDGYFIGVVFQAEEYQGKMQARVDNIKIITQETGFSPAEIIPSSPESPAAMYADIINTINGMHNPELQFLCGNIIQENQDALLKCPGAKSMHHAEVGGLLHHMTGMLAIGKSVANLFPNIDKDLLFTGIILHDICKISEFTLGPVGLCTDYSMRGKLLGHISMGVSYIEAKCREMNLSGDIMTLVAHMLLSHHRTPEFGSPIAPMFPEAILLSMIDDMDAKMNMAQSVLENVPVGSFSERVFGLGNIQLYNHGQI